MADRAHTVLLRDDSLSGLFHVEIVPPLDAGNFDQSFKTHKQARGYAGGLRLCLGFPLVDKTAEGLANGAR
jgi:hypothetical protein